MRLLSLAASVALLAPFATLSAQQQPRVEPGARVRVSQCHSELRFNGQRRNVCERSVGTLSTLSANTLEVADGADGLVFALASVTRFDVYSGRKSHLWVGAGIGLLAGAGAGAVTWTDCGMVDDSQCRRYGALLFGGIGAVVGGVVGAFIWKTDKWEEVPLDRLRVSFAPKRDGFAFGLSVAF